jgi:hypothetical protein
LSGENESPAFGEETVVGQIWSLDRRSDSTPVPPSPAIVLPKAVNPYVPARNVDWDLDQQLSRQGRRADH